MSLHSGLDTVSIAVSRRVWESSQHSGAAFTVLLALADYATDDGVAYPGIDALARKCRLSERTTQYAIGQLRDSGEIFVETGGGRHRTHRYIIGLSETVQSLHRNGSGGPDETVQSLHPITRETVQELHPSLSETVQSTTETVQTTVGNGADSAPNPSLPTRSTVSTPRNKQHQEDIREIYAYFREKIQPASRTCADDKIRARLKKFTVAELKEGIDRFAAHSWSMDHNAHRGSAWFFANDTRSEMYLTMEPDGGSVGVSPQNLIEQPTANGAGSKVTPATADDLAVWDRVLTDLRGLTSSGNFETYLAPLTVGGRNEAGGLCLIVPPTLSGSEMLGNFRPTIRRALMDAGDPAPTAVAFKARRSSREQPHAE